MPVTDEMLRHPDAGDWLMIRRNYEAQSHSPLTQITRPMSETCGWSGPGP